MPKAYFAAGCFWGVEESFRVLPGVLSTAVGYAGGRTENPTYEQVCGGATGHAETVEVEYDPQRISYAALLETFWRGHDPTTLNRQGPDVGTQYRSAIFWVSEEQAQSAADSKETLNAGASAGQRIVTEIMPLSAFYRAEDYHQQYFSRRGLRHHARVG